MRKTTVKDSITNGIVIGGAGNMVEQSTSNSNGNNGIKLKANSSYAILEGNTTNKNAKFGINNSVGSIISESRNNICSNNVSCGSNPTGL